MDKAWIVMQGDSYAIRTNYAGIVAVFRHEKGNIMRGNEPTNPRDGALQYLRAMVRYGCQIDETMPAEPAPEAEHIKAVRELAEHIAAEESGLDGVGFRWPVCPLASHPLNNDPGAMPCSRVFGSIGRGRDVYRHGAVYLAALPGGMCFRETFPSFESARAAQDSYSAEHG